MRSSSGPVAPRPSSALNDVLALPVVRKPFDISGLLIRPEGRREIVWLDSVESVLGLPKTGDDLYGLPADAYVRRSFEVGRRGRQAERPFWIYLDRLHDFIARAPCPDRASASKAKAFLDAVEANLFALLALGSKLRWRTATESGREAFVELLVGTEVLRLVFDPDGREVWMTSAQASLALDKSERAFRMTLSRLVAAGRLDVGLAGKRVMVRVGDGTFRAVNHYRWSTVMAIARAGNVRSYNALLTWMDSVVRVVPQDVLTSGTHRLADFSGRGL